MPKKNDPVANRGRRASKKELKELLEDVQAFLNNPKALIGRALDLLYAQRDESVSA